MVDRAPDARTTFPSTPAGIPRLDAERAPENPLDLLGSWWRAVIALGATDPSYVTLATASTTGIPSSRTVQLLDVETDALLFSTNEGSRKGVEMHATGRAAVSLYWRETAQSINVTGRVLWADDAENEERFAAESRAVQASRIVSFHGRPLDDEAAQLARFTTVVESGEPLRRPAYWRWFRLVPDGVTFWEGVPQALNRRLHYAREGNRWTRRPIQA
ncbi:phenazine biosynthesis protein [Humibacter sp. BT305]|nr:phenazine biosynthesis protein [Humibacter sp. BT305]